MKKHNHLHIVHVTGLFYPSTIGGGPPANVLTISKGLQKRGHHVEILTSNILDHTTSMSNNSFQDTWEGIPVTYLKTHTYGKRPSSNGFNLAPDLWRYRQLIRDADIVHIHVYREFFFLACSLLAYAYNVPVVVQARGSLPSRFGRAYLKKIYDPTVGRCVLKKAAHVVSLSTDESIDYARLGVHPSRIAKIYNPFDPMLCPQLPDKLAFRQKYGMNAEEKNILFLSRLHEKKGVDLLIRAVGNLHRQDVRLCIVGPDDGYLLPAQKLVTELGLDHKTIFTGSLSGTEKFAAYRAADVYVLPTRGMEGFPTTIMEACYAETPIIITKTTEAAQVVDGRVGLAVECDEHSISKALETILDNPELQQSYRSQMASVMREYFDLETALDKIEALYWSCLR